MGAVITKVPTGIKYDLSNMTGAGVSFPKYVFRPSNSSTIIKLEAYDAYLKYTTIDSTKQLFNYDGADGITKVDSIDGVVPTDNYNLFDLAIAIL